MCSLWLVLLHFQEAPEIVGWTVCKHRDLHCSVFAGKWVLNEKLSWTCFLIFEEHLICNVDTSHYVEKFALLAHFLSPGTCWY